MDSQFNFHPATVIRNHPELLPLLSPADLLEAIPNPPSQFASALAHEIRNPLTTINLATDMLESAIEDKDLRNYLDIIRRNSLRINNAIYALVKHQDAEKEKEKTYPIHQLLDEVLEMAEDRLLLKNIVVKKEYTTENCPMLSNRPMIKIALTNIVINAIDAMPWAKGELRLKESSVGGKYALLIEDNGCGISKENLECIFRPYFTNKPGGLGLGLSTTYDILRSDRVEINVTSEVGVGTCFTLVFDHGQPSTYKI